jgi:hypothetical protein
MDERSLFLGNYREEIEVPLVDVAVATAHLLAADPDCRHLYAGGTEEINCTGFTSPPTTIGAAG